MGPKSYEVAKELVHEIRGGRRQLRLVESRREGGISGSSKRSQTSVAIPAAGGGSGIERNRVRGRRSLGERAKKARTPRRSSDRKESTKPRKPLVGEKSFRRGAGGRVCNSASIIRLVPDKVEDRGPLRRPKVYQIGGQKRPLEGLNVRGIIPFLRGGAGGECKQKNTEKG